MLFIFPLCARSRSTNVRVHLSVSLQCKRSASTRAAGAANEDRSEFIRPLACDRSQSRRACFPRARACRCIYTFNNPFVVNYSRISPPSLPLIRNSRHFLGDEFPCRTWYMPDLYMCMDGCLVGTSARLSPSKTHSAKAGTSVSMGARIERTPVTSFPRSAQTANVMVTIAEQ